MTVATVERRPTDAIRFVKMRTSKEPEFVAARALYDALGGKKMQVAIPIANGLSQLMWATFLRSRRTYEAISFLLGREYDTQAAMLARPLFEDMLVMHWLDLNRDDPDWLVGRFVRQREAIALDQIEMEEKYSMNSGPLVTSNAEALKSKQNALVKEFRARARRDWWDPGKEGRGRGAPIGIDGVAAILHDVAEQRKCFYPRFAGGEEPLLVPLTEVIMKWFNRQLHHTAIGLGFQPNPTGEPLPTVDPLIFLRVMFLVYWTFGQCGYVLLEHLGKENSAEYKKYSSIFLNGLHVTGSQILKEGPSESAAR